MEIIVVLVIVGLVIWWLSTRDESPGVPPPSVERDPEVRPNPAVTRSGETVGSEVFGRSNEITSGKEGTVYEIPQHRLIDVEGRMVFKRLSDREHDVRGQFDALSAFFFARPLHAQERIMRATAWPLQLAHDGGIPTGFVMRRATKECWILVTGPKGSRETLADLTYLASDDSYLRKREISPLPTSEERIGILAGLAELLAILHEGGAVYGDLSLVNTAYSTRPPGVFLLDCDSIRVLGSPPTLKQLDAFDYVPPEPGPPTRAGDVYKFARLAQDVLAQPFHAPSAVERKPRTVEQLPGPDGELLLERSLSHDPDQRPQIREWARFLQSGSPLPPPTQPPDPPRPPDPPDDEQRTGGWVKDEHNRWVTAGPGTASPASDPPPAVESPSSGWVRDPATGEWRRSDRNE